MLNFGLTEMRLVAPRDGWPNPDAGPAASGADVVLENAQVFETVQEAIADCPAVYASTVRRRDLVMPVVTPEAMADQIARSTARSAILFGPERSGLETEEVALAQAIVTVPINPAFASLNLAQAVILLAYEWSKTSELAVPPDKALEPPAPHEFLELPSRPAGNEGRPHPHADGEGGDRGDQRDPACRLRADEQAEDSGHQRESDQDCQHWQAAHCAHQMAQVAAPIRPRSITKA